MENFNQFVYQILSFNISMSEHQGDIYYILSDPLETSVYSEEHTRLRVRAAVELLNLNDDTSKKHLNRLNRFLSDILKKLYRFDEKSFSDFIDYCWTNDIIVNIEEKHPFGVKIITRNLIADLIEEINNRQYFLTQIQRSVFFENQAVKNTTNHVERKQAIAKPIMDCFEFNLLEKDTAIELDEVPDNEWLIISKINSSKNKISLEEPELAIRYSYLIRSGYRKEEFTAAAVAKNICREIGKPTHDEKFWKNLQKFFIAYHPYQKTSGDKKTPRAEQLNNILKTLEDYPEAIKLVKKDLEDIL